MTRAVWKGVALLVMPLCAFGQEVPAPKDLPGSEQANAWIDKDPAVVEARSALAAAGHSRAAQAASPHEWTAKVQGQRRDYRDTSRKSNEWLAQLERPIRVNGKGELDRQLGEIDLEIGRARVGEARHEAARALADLWLDVIAARGQQALLKEQLAFAERNLSAVGTRKKAGDASSLDVNVARTDLSEVQRQASLTATQLAKAEAKLRVRFGDALPTSTALSEPQAPVLPQAPWRERVLAEADPLKIAEGQRRKTELLAARTKADRVPDPTVGVYTASEAIRNERVVGISLSIPLSGTYREQRMLQALRDSDTARAAQERHRQEIELEAAETYAEAAGSLDRWRVGEQGASIAGESAQLMQRAYSLGEADLQALLLARRQSLDASRAALEARADALRWHHRLLIDAHLIWDLAKD
ncbi:MAG: TolC family protein [Burkholderiales bacterium]|nr:TolC family protein [Burkholderiales bacterium]